MLRHTLSLTLRSAFVAFAQTASGDSPSPTPAVKASPANAVREESDPTISDLKLSIPALVEKARIPGLQIALIRDGEPVWEGAFGITSTDEGVVVTPETIFEAASLTKPLFAYVVMQMVDKKLFDLDTPLIGSLLKERIEQLLGHPLDAEGFRLDWASKINARHILSHSAGMPHGESGEVYPLFFEPGSDWEYSAAGYRFLQFVVEGIEGKPLEEIVDAYVLEPLGMEHSSMVWREAYAKTMANGHSLYGTREEFRRRRQVNSAASLYTTAGDYARFVCAVLDGKRLEREPETVSSLGGSLDYDVAIFPPPLGMTQQREVHHPIPIG